MVDICQTCDRAETEIRPDVLLVEDDDSVRDALKLMLESHGLTVRDYPSGPALFDAADMATGTPRAGCFVIDYHMPGMSGLDVLARLRAGQSPGPAILITGRTNAAKRLRAITVAEAMAVLEKPFPPTDLLRLVNNALGRSADIATAAD